MQWRIKYPQPLCLLAALYQSLVKYTHMAFGYQSFVSCQLSPDESWWATEHERHRRALISMLACVARSLAQIRPRSWPAPLLGLPSTVQAKMLDRSEHHPVDLRIGRLLPNHAGQVTRPLLHFCDARFYSSSLSCPRSAICRLVGRTDGRTDMNYGVTAYIQTRRPESTTVETEKNEEDSHDKKSRNTSVGGVDSRKQQQKGQLSPSSFVWFHTVSPDSGDIAASAIALSIDIDPPLEVEQSMQVTASELQRKKHYKCQEEFGSGLNWA